MDSDTWNILILGTASGILATIIASKFMNSGPTGRGAGNQPMLPSQGATSGGERTGVLYVMDLEPTDINSSPVAQVNPNTEASYNQQNHPYEPAFGSKVNQPGDLSEPVLPI